MGGMVAAAALGRDGLKDSRRWSRCVSDAPTDALMSKEEK
jgi:hypothetical protein